MNKEQDNCEAINFANANAAETLSVMHDQSMINGAYGDLGSIEMRNMMSARVSGKNGDQN